MTAEELIRNGIFAQLCIRGFSRKVATFKADEAVEIYRKNLLPDGVRFPDLLRHILRSVGKPLAQGGNRALFLEAVVTGRVGYIKRKKPEAKTWHVCWTSAEYSHHYRFSDEFIQKFVRAEYLTISEDGTTAEVSTDFDWFPKGVKKIDVRSPAKEAA